jgi:hypothetical protein
MSRHRQLSSYVAALILVSAACRAARCVFLHACFPARAVSELHVVESCCLHTAWSPVQCCLSSCEAAAILAAAKLVDRRKRMQLLLVFLCRCFIRLTQERGLCQRSIGWPNRDMVCC